MYHMLPRCLVSPVVIVGLSVHSLASQLPRATSSLLAIGYRVRWNLEPRVKGCINNVKLEMQLFGFFGEPAFCGAKHQKKLNCSRHKFAAFKRTENWSQVHGWVINVSFKLSTSFYHFMWPRVLLEFLLYYGFYIFQLSSCSLSNILSFQLDLRQSTKNWFKKLPPIKSNVEHDITNPYTNI